MTDNQSRIDDLLEEIQDVQKKLDTNPFNASANARYKYLKTILDELVK